MVQYELNNVKSYSRYSSSTNPNRKNPANILQMYSTDYMDIEIKPNFFTNQRVF